MNSEIKEIIKNIISQDEYKKIMSNTNSVKVYNDLSMFIKSKSDTLDTNSVSYIIDILYISYLNKLNALYPEEHILEKTYIKIYQDIDERIAEYIISQNIDLRYTSSDRFGMPCTIADTFAIYTSSKEVMRYVVQKLKPTGQIVFKNEAYDSETDLCKMNIVAGLYNDAFDVFINPKYKLQPTDIELNTLKDAPDGIYIHGLFNGFRSIGDINTDDTLYTIIKLLASSDSKNDDKIEFLKKVLYSQKYTLFNIATLSIIKNILDKDEYVEFIDYLLDNAKMSRINLYKINRKGHSNSINVMAYVSSIELEQKEKQKILKMNTNMHTA